MATVLLVDDDVGLLGTLGLLIAAEGHLVRTATNGRDALRLAPGHRGDGLRNAGDGRHFARARNEAVCRARVGSGHSYIGRAEASPCQGIRLSQKALSCHRVATADASASPTSVDEQDRCISEKVARGLYVGGNARERKAVVVAVSLSGNTELWNAHCAAGALMARSSVALNAWFL
jgi:CheY-like chemotaxis protein